MIGIKNMALPSDCSECPVAVINDGFKCMLTDKKFYHISNSKRQEWCPLIEIECIHTNPENSPSDERTTDKGMFIPSAPNEAETGDFSAKEALAEIGKAFVKFGEAIDKAVK